MAEDSPPRTPRGSGRSLGSSNRPGSGRRVSGAVRPARSRSPSSPGGRASSPPGSPKRSAAEATRHATLVLRSKKSVAVAAVPKSAARTTLQGTTPRPGVALVGEGAARATLLVGRPGAGPPGNARHHRTRTSFRVEGLGPAAPTRKRETMGRGRDAVKVAEPEARIDGGGRVSFVGGKGSTIPGTSVEDGRGRARGRAAMTDKGLAAARISVARPPGGANGAAPSMGGGGHHLRQIIHQKVTQKSTMFATRNTLLRQRAGRRRAEEARLRFLLVEESGDADPVEKELTFATDDMTTWWKVLKAASAAYAPCPDGLEIFRPVVGRDRAAWLRLLSGETRWRDLDADEMTDDVTWTRGLQTWEREAEARHHALTTRFCGKFGEDLADSRRSSTATVATLNALWEFAQRPENLETLSDGTLRAILDRLDVDNGGDVLKAACRCLWKLGELDVPRGLRQRLVNLGILEKLLRLIEAMTAKAATSDGARPPSPAAPLDDGDEAALIADGDVLYTAAGCLVTLIYRAPALRVYMYAKRGLDVLATTAVASTEDTGTQLVAMQGLWFCIKSSQQARVVFVKRHGFAHLAKLAKSRGVDVLLLAVVALGVLATDAAVKSGGPLVGTLAALHALMDLCLWCAKEIRDVGVKHATLLSCGVASRAESRPIRDTFQLECSDFSPRSSGNYEDPSNWPVPRNRGKRVRCDGGGEF